MSKAKTEHYQISFFNDKKIIRKNWKKKTKMSIFLQNRVEFGDDNHCVIMNSNEQIKDYVAVLLNV